jgi:flagellar hook protein FlgE
MADEGPDLSEEARGRKGKAQQMMRAMFAAISGLKAHQVMLDVVGSNIANVNTVGYKASRVSFKDSLAQTMRAASSPTASLGGSNPMQISLGVQLNSIDTINTTGALQATNNPLDVAIQGDGYFRISTYGGTSFGEIEYTRAGNFQRDTDGYLVSPEGYYVVGYTLDGNGAPTTTETRIQIPTDARAVTIGQDGIVNIIDANGAPQKIAALSMAKFPNDAGLDRVAGSRFRASNNSGAEAVGTAGASGLGTLMPASVEMSNVDLAQEFTSMITAQRGFQANSRVITAADEMLQELVNLKR